MPPQMPAEILKLRELISSDPTGGASATGAWDEAWRANVTPWDSKLKDVQPSLRELVEDNWSHVGSGIEWETLIENRGRALVAGCGRGYDAAYFASRGIDALGIDLSQTAVDAARQHLATLSGAPSNVEFRAANFFEFENDRAFSLAYDFTFFCAIPPATRQRWGDRYAELIRPGGVLITLEYPLDGDREGGPPFSVSEQAYDQVLSSNFEKVYSEVPTKQTEGHEGREKIVVWQRK